MGKLCTSAAWHVLCSVQGICKTHEQNSHDLVAQQNTQEITHLLGLSLYRFQITKLQSSLADTNLSPAASSEIDHTLLVCPHSVSKQYQSSPSSAQTCLHASLMQHSSSAAASCSVVPASALQPPMARMNLIKVRLLGNKYGRDSLLNCLIAIYLDSVVVAGAEQHSICRVPSHHL